MMSDHWKKLANLLGTPGPADPPETAAKSDAGDVPAAKKPEAVRPAPPAQAPAAAPAPPPAVQAAPRKRSSMWGDEPSDKPAVVPPSDALEEMSVVKREPPVPGFDVPESRSPEPPETPAKRSAWDTLISTLGIKAPAEPEEQRPRAEPPAPSRPPQEPVEAAGFGGFGAGLIEPEKSPRRSEATAAPSRSEQPANGREGDQDRPRGRGRRGTARHRGGLEEPARAPAAEIREPAAEIGWDPEPPSFSARPERSDEPASERPRRSEERSSGGVRSGAFGDEESSSEDARRRRPRRRGQRQMLSLSDTELDRPAREPGAGRTPGELGPAQREENGGRDRGPRRDRGEESRGERGSRPGRGEEGRRGEPRAAQRRAEIDEPRLQADDELEGFGGDLLADVSPPRSGDDEGPSRPRRRRGRRGRGGAGPRSEEALRSDEPLRSEAELEEEDPWAPVSAAPEFDDDYEDDDEADQLRRRSRGGRGRGGRRDTAAGPRAENAPAGLDEPARPERVAAAKQYSAPTWLETVNLLVDANIQRRGVGGGSGSSRGSQGGRGGRR